MDCDKKYDLITISSKFKDIDSVIEISGVVSKSELNTRTEIVIQRNRDTMFGGGYYERKTK